MRIHSGGVTLAATHRRDETISFVERLRRWATQPPSAPQEKLTLSALARESLSAHSKALSSRSSESDPVAGAREQLEGLILEKLFGVRRQLPTEAKARTQAPAPPPQKAPPPTPSFGLEFERVEMKAGREQLEVQAKAQVTTADGRQIDAQLALVQTRSWVQQGAVHGRMTATPKVDPLALDLNGDGVKLMGQKMSFDLNSDGQAEQISRLAPGDAWLARDLNGNGRIDNGKELFGPQSGSGFGELATLDSDGDGFIDEDDQVFAQLRLWRPNGVDGAGSLRTLAEEGVGAISVSAVASPFEQTGGATRETGVFLREDGTAGAVQHVDLEV